MAGSLETAENVVMFMAGTYSVICAAGIEQTASDFLGKVCAEEMILIL